MTTVPNNTASAEFSDTDRSARCSLSFLIVLSLLWLLAGGVLAMLNLMQLHSPEFLADCSLFTHGRLQALQETALVYGWAVNAGLAVALWLLSRLGATPLRGSNYVVLGAIFWTIAVKLGLIGIATGDMTSFSFLQMPRYVQPLMLTAFAMMAAPGVLAWTGRRSESTFAAQWYAVAALFLFPWVFSVAQVMLLYVPVRGVLQPILATWFSQNLFSLYLAPLAVAVLYYLVPKIKGRVLPAYDFAIYGFWSLILFGSWMGGRHLVGGPVPAWIPSMAIVASVLILFHHMILCVNLRGVFSTQGSTVLKFAAFGLAAYLTGGLVDAIFSARSLALLTQFTYFQEAQTQLAMAAFSMSIFAAFYYLAPRLMGAAWPSTGLIRAHYLASVLGFSVLILSLAVAGWNQGVALNNASLSFAEISSVTHAWLLVATAAQALLVAGNLALTVHFIRLLFVKQSPASATLFRQPPTVEASAS